MIPLVAIPPEVYILVGALVVIITLARWGWNARKREARLRAWLEQAKAEQEGRKRFDETLEQTSGGLGKRIRARLFKPPDR